MRERCDSCKWFAKAPIEGAGGLCKNLPPVPLAVKGNERGAQMQVMPLYPPVLPEDGCSKHEPGIVVANA